MKERYRIIWTKYPDSRPDGYYFILPVKNGEPVWYSNSWHFNDKGNLWGKL